MTVQHKNRNTRSVLEYRQAEAIARDPLRRLATTMIACGVVASLLVLADAIRYVYHVPANSEPPMLVDLEATAGNLVDKDKGDQLDKKDEDEKPKQEEKKQEEKPVEDPPAVKTVDDARPTGPATSAEPSDKTEIIAVAGTGRTGGSPYANRGAQARTAARGKYGGDARTENAVELALIWLARHQDKDGRWSCTRFHKHCKGGRCTGAGQYTVPVDPALTGLAMLCFAAHDNTHREGRYKDNVADAVKYLLGTQAKSGCFGKFPRAANQYMMYNHGIVAFALAELYAMSGDERLRKPVEKAVRFIVISQQLNGGWDYTDPKTGRYDTSVTGWQVMALKSAQAGGIDIPTYTLFKLARFFDTVTLSNGEVVYSNAFPSTGRRGQGMVAVGMASRQFMGLPLHDALAKRQASIVLGHLPAWRKLSLSQTPMDSIYYWYYATLAMFQYGGAGWRKWNTQMKRTLLVNQRRSGCVKGSWDPPKNFWAKVGGRLYATTLNTLNLEVYYRYLPVYGAGTLKVVDALVDTIKTKGHSNAVQAVRLLGTFGDDAARRHLIQLAHGDNHMLAMEASVALAGRKDAAAIEPLLNQLRSTNQFVRYRAVRSLAPMIGRGLTPVFIQCLRDKKATVSRQAAKVLREYASASFGFEPELSEAEREQAIKKWQAWWEAHQDGKPPAEHSLPWLVVEVRDARGLVAFSTAKPGQVKTGQRCKVYRAGTYVGQINVVAVDRELGLGKVIAEFTAHDIKKGDVVKPSP